MASKERPYLTDLNSKAGELFAPSIFVRRLSVTQRSALVVATSAAKATLALALRAIGTKLTLQCCIWRPITFKCYKS